VKLLRRLAALLERTYRPIDDLVVPARIGDADQVASSETESTGVGVTTRSRRKWDAVLQDWLEFLDP